MKKEYSHLETKIIPIEADIPILAGSVQTIEKEFTVETGEYVLEDDNWYNSSKDFTIIFD